MKSASDIGRRNGDDEFAFWLDFAFLGELGLEVASALPPVISAIFDLLWLVGVNSGGLLDLLLLGFGIDSRSRLSLLCFGLLGLKFGQLVGLLTLFLDYEDRSVCSPRGRIHSIRTFFGSLLFAGFAHHSLTSIIANLIFTRRSLTDRVVLCGILHSGVQVIRNRWWRPGRRASRRSSYDFTLAVVSASSAVLVLALCEAALVAMLNLFSRLQAGGGRRRKVLRSILAGLRYQYAIGE